MATVSLSGMNIEVPHSLPPGDVVARLEAFGQDLARNRFPDWGIVVKRAEGDGLHLSGQRHGTHFSADLRAEPSKVVVEVHGKVSMGGLILRMAGGAPGLRRRVQDAITDSLRSHLGS